MGGVRTAGIGGMSLARPESADSSQSEISREFSRVGGSIDQLYAAFERLELRVHPVVANRPAAKEASNPVVPNCSTTIGKGLREHSDKIFNLCDAIVTLTNQIEL